MIEFVASQHFTSVTNYLQGLCESGYKRVHPLNIIPSVDCDSQTYQVILEILGDPDMTGLPQYVDNLAFNWCFTMIKSLFDPNSLNVLIEYPETFLSPYAQSNLVSFLVAAHNQTGVNITLKSHSDHIFNGLRIAVKVKDIKPNEVKVIWFDQSETINVSIDTDANYTPNSKLFNQLDNDLNVMIGLADHKENPFKNIVIDSNGKLHNKPKGFFDTYTSQMAKLF